jgi:probable biosynthetic protein (TIGR04098 family)
MLIENIELTMSHVGLGTLNEYALMVLFGNAHSHHLVQGLDITADKIKDEQGLTLYPAYFMTHLKVPSHLPLSSYKLWDKVDVGVDVVRFGDTILKSAYVLGKEGDVPEDTSKWSPEEFPYMKGCNLITVDVSELGGTNRRVSVPRQDCIASLPKISRPPEALSRARNIRTNGFDINISKKLHSKEPFTYVVMNDQDAAPGHAMLFAKYVKIMDWAEHLLLSEQLKPGFQLEVLQNLSTLEREIYYYGNCFAGETLDVFIHGDIKECEPDFHGDALNIISAAILTFQIEIYQQKRNSLLAIAYVNKLLALPTSMQDLIPDVRRIIKKIHF